jgi:hypothetical protein
MTHWRLRVFRISETERNRARLLVRVSTAEILMLTMGISLVE